MRICKYQQIDLVHTLLYNIDAILNLDLGSIAMVAVRVCMAESGLSDDDSKPA